MCSFVSVDQKVSLLNKRPHMYLYRALKLIYSNETPKSMQRDTVSLKTQAGHHWPRGRKGCASILGFVIAVGVGKVS